MNSYPYWTDLLRALGVEMRLPIPLFGTFVALAILAGMRLARGNTASVFRAPGLAVDAGTALVDILVSAVLWGMAGAKLFHVLENLGAFWRAPLAMLFSSGGFTIYGGLLLGGLAFILSVRRRGLPLFPALDAAMPAYVLAYGIGRIGCQVAGDGDWGLAADLALKPEWLPLRLWAQTYEGNVLGVAIPAPGVYPTPLYESLMAFAVVTLWWPRRRTLWRVPGLTLALGCIAIAAMRLAIEPIRVNNTMEAFGLAFTQAQAISAGLLLAGLALAAERLRRFRA